MLEASIEKNDKKAKQLIWIFSTVVFVAVVLLSNVKLNVDPGFDIHIFAKVNAYINATIAFLLLAALLSVKNRKYRQHKNLMIAALILSIIFLVSYIAHHLLAGEAKFGDANHNGIVEEAEALAVGSTRYIYYIILATHIFLAAVILPFILFTAYRAMIAEFPAHKKLARYTWPLWFYVAVTGPVIYYFISPYYY
ncbi:DUF420 domain-containing protein [Panacibacter sp. DH6]|uniref:DUF420 domain-containing protein n=1 Tax=Panacibacter microcysteis TaxID=2793269 RepID=A0A931GV20_9BACT|nr:DUF420 domain-containing protein [Panacibacter microcysteis]MBG9375955.1 DUF420 domain-containing protein [Panacibacter microcysteis]